MSHSRNGRPLDFESIAIHADDGIEITADIAPPIHQTSTFEVRSADEFAELCAVTRPPRLYTRDGNPTFQRAEAIIAALEGAESALLFASGMGAISATVQTVTGQGDHIVAQKNHYTGTSRLLGYLMPKFGVEVTLVDQTDNGAIERAITPRTKLIMVESPSNPTMQITDLRAVGAMGKQLGIVTMADNTFASPVNQRPLDLGVDLIVHSGTKYLGGHHDLMAGVIAGSKELVDQVWWTSVVVGAIPGPFDAWLLIRGMRTLSLRIRQHNESAMFVAKALEEHPGIERVNYQGLESHPQHQLARSQMTGFGGTLSFQVKGGYESTARFMERLRLIKQAVSLGGFETLAVHAAAMWAGKLTEEEVRAAGVQPNMVRLSIGLESASDILADLDQALG